MTTLNEANIDNSNNFDLNTLGQYYCPISTTSTDYQNQQFFKKETAVSPSIPSSNKKLPNSSLKNNTKVKKTKKMGKMLILKDSMNHQNSNISCRISRNENNLNEITTMPTLEEKEVLSKNLYNENESRKKIIEMKELILCSICRQKPISPKMCPNCQKIACEKCAKYYFETNKKCFYCNKETSFEEMISIPIIDSLSNIIEKLVIDTNLTLKPKYNTCKNNIKVIERTSNKFLNLGKNNIIIKNKLNEKNENVKVNIENIDNCKIHTDQTLAYYCVQCKKAYCKTCFVFFGDEKNKHEGHEIISYEKYKTINSNEIVKQSEDLDAKYDEINAYINRCKALKNCYEFERKIVIKYFNLLVDNYNEQVNDNIKLLNDLINSYNNHLTQIKKGQKDIQKYYTWKLNDENNKLLTDIIKINNMKYYTSKEIDSYSNLSSKIFFNVYQTDLKKFIISKGGFHFKTNLNGSKYQLGLIQKKNEIQLYIYYPLEENMQKKKFILPFVFLRKKNNNWESFELKESMTYKGNNYFIKRFKSFDFLPMDSYIKIKGIIYESWFD